jgi:predicted ribosome quality control (RQC) complex YloA/Tae2 family protein
MHNNYLFLKHLASELKVKLLGSALLSCFSQEKDELMLGFNTYGNDVYLKCTLKPDFSCITIQNEFARAKKNTVNLWSEIYGLKVIDFSIFENERALKIYLENDYLLIIKLFGNRPNLLVYKNNEQIAIFNNALLSDKSLKISDFEKNADFSFENFQKLEGNYRKVFFTFGKNLFNYLDAIIKDYSIDQKWDLIQDFLKKQENPKYQIGFFTDIPSLCLFPIANYKFEFTNAVEAVNAFYLFYQKEFSFSNQKHLLVNALEKEKQKTENYLQNTQTKLETLKSGQSKEIIANILMANLHHLEEGISEVELLNFYTDQHITIKLKKDLSPQKNAENYYRKSKNEEIEVKTIEKNIETAFNKIIEIESQIERVKAAENFKELKSFVKIQKKVSEETESPKSLFREYEFEGNLILVGKNSKNNDTLTLKHAQKEDYWLHARDCSGSHVVIKRKNKENLPNHVIEFAASLAAYYSKRKNEGVVPVIFTQKKFVRKTKGLPDGQVIVDKESTIMIEPFKPGL